MIPPVQLCSSEGAGVVVWRSVGHLARGNARSQGRWGLVEIETR